MELLINPGGPSDRESIDLATSKNRRIPDWRRRERAPAALQEAKRILTEGYPGRRLRSLTATYNCIGMAFASRRTCIEPDEVEMILRDDGYAPVETAAAVMPGDLVVYETETAPGEISHVAVVVSNDPNLQDGSSRIRVLSQWGWDGEYLHDYQDVPPLLGRPVRFYTERRKE
jgi:hypothetical protein